MTIFDSNEIAALFNLCLPFVRKEFPKTPVSCDENEETSGMHRSNRRICMFLTLTHSRNINSSRFLTGLVGFNHGYLSKLNKRCEFVMLDDLFEGHIKKPSIEELKIDIKHFHDTHSFNGVIIHIGFMQDFRSHVIC